MRPPSHRSNIAPRLLTRQQAAAFIGVSEPTFMIVCPIRPIALGPGKRLERYDIRALEQWIDELGRRGASVRTDWLAVLDAEK
jgi:hypothetical protein